MDPIRFQVGAALAPPPPPPPPDPEPPRAPTAGSTLLAQGTTGQVRVRPPGQSGLVPLGAAAGVPVGALVDTRKGSVVLQSIVDGTLQSMTVSRGVRGPPAGERAAGADGRDAGGQGACVRDTA